MIVHVRDISNPETEKQYQVVNEILEDLIVSSSNKKQPILEVWNKIDLLENNQNSNNQEENKTLKNEKEYFDSDSEFPSLDLDSVHNLFANHPNRENIVLCSAKNRSGFDQLIQKIESNINFNQESKKKNIISFFVLKKFFLKEFEVFIPNGVKDHGKMINYLFENSKILEEELNENFSKMIVMLDNKNFFHFQQKFPNSKINKID